ncbi:unnamed protein product [marine sediment metagenome]|uniref:Uncharacterized protein n=1 Tax=marine sediment metagenome TaxID=412755 RepID=X0UMD3_9ZZZZ
MITGRIPNDPDVAWRQPKPCEWCRQTIEKPTRPNQMLYSPECRHAHAKAKRVAKSEAEAPGVGDREAIGDMPFPIMRSETEFAAWFEANFAFFGFAEILRNDIGSTPDYVMRSGTGEVWLVELEYYAPNFRRHGHDISRCDLVIAYLQPRETDHPLPLPVIALLEVVEGTITELAVADVQPTAFTQRMLRTAHCELVKTQEASGHYASSALRKAFT